MGKIKGILQDKTVNDLATAFIIAFSTVLFITNVVTTAGFQFSENAANPRPFVELPWRSIVVQLVVYIICIAVAVIVRTQLNPKSKS